MSAGIRLSRVIVATSMFVYTYILEDIEMINPATYFFLSGSDGRILWEYRGFYWQGHRY